MKNYLKFVSVILLLGLTASCSSEGSSAAHINYTVYKNQTDDVNADGLQLHYVSDDNYYRLNFYGNFDENKNPTSTNTIVYDDGTNKVNMIINPITKRLSSLFVKDWTNVTSNVVMKFDYQSDIEVKVSFYDYDWTTNTSSDIYMTKVIKVPSANKSPFYAKDGSSTFAENIAALAVSIGIVETVATIGGGWTLIGTLSGAAAALVASVSSVAIAAAAAIAATIFFLNEASAAPITVSDQVPPSDIPLQNPVTTANNPTGHLPQSPCFNNNISFIGTMDAAGSIMISGVSGGVAPYTYLVESTIQANPVFANEYGNGSYLIGVKDASGCMSVKVQPFSMEFGSVVGNWKLTSRYDETNHAESGDDCAYNNTLNLASNNTFVGKDYKNNFSACELEAQYSGNYSVNGQTISFSNSAFGGPLSGQVAFVSDYTLKLRFVQDGISTLQTYAKQ